MSTVKRVRKRRIDTSEEGQQHQVTPDDIDSPDLQALFKKHFEAQFEPLPEKIFSLPSSSKNTEEAEDESNDCDLCSTWEGLSDEDKPAPKLIQHGTSETAIPIMTNEEYKTFMVCRTYMPSRCKVLIAPFRRQNPPPPPSPLCQRRKILMLTTPMPPPTLPT